MASPKSKGHKAGQQTEPETNKKQQRGTLRPKKFLPGQFKAAVKVLEAVGSLGSTVALFLGHYTLLLWVLVSLAIGAAYLLFGYSKKLIGIALISIIAGFVIQHFVLAARNPPFSVGIETAFISQTRDSTFVAEYAGHFVSPIPVILFMRIVNLQNIPSSISDLRVQISMGREWWGLGRRWINISLLPAGMPLRVLGSPHDPTANTLTLLGPQIGAALEQAPIGPHVTVRGWALFDAPREFNSAPRPLIYRIIIEDTAGRGLTTVVNGATVGGDILGSHALKFGPQVQVPPNLIVKHFFFPN